MTIFNNDTNKDNPITEGVTEKDREKARAAIFHSCDSNCYIHCDVIQKVVESIAAERKQVMRETLKLPEVYKIYDHLITEHECSFSCEVCEALKNFQSLQERLK